MPRITHWIPFVQHYEKHLIFVTTNLPLESRCKIIVDAAAASAVLDRLLNHATAILVKAKGFCLQKNLQSFCAMACPLTHKLLYPIFHLLKREFYKRILPAVSQGRKG